jgi:hypothetical protein
MAKMTTITCKCGCGLTREVRQADVNRGWGLYYDKSHKARHQEKRTGQYAAYLEREECRDDDDNIGHIFESGYFGHGQE